jgi:hypothetical protein
MLALAFIAPPAFLGLALTLQALESRLLSRPGVGDRRQRPEDAVVTNTDTSSQP